MRCFDAMALPEREGSESRLIQSLKHIDHNPEFYISQLQENACGRSVAVMCTYPCKTHYACENPIPTT